MNIEQITFETLSSRIAKIAAAESITRAELGALSREVLAFVVATEDVRIINTLLGKGEDGKFTLTSNNRRVAGLYFKEFTPFTVAETDSGIVQFAKKKAKVWDKGVAKIEAFLAVEDNNLWTWAETNVEIEGKPAEYAGKLTKLVQKSLADEVEGITGADVINAVLAGGVTVEDLLGMVEALTNVQQAA